MPENVAKRGDGTAEKHGEVGLLVRSPFVIHLPIKFQISNFKVFSKA